MEEKCPNCGETLLAKTIKKKIGIGSIDYTVAQICPKCKWKKDLTGAGDIIPKPVFQVADDAKKPEIKTGIKPVVSNLPPSKTVAASPIRMNSLIPILLAILVIGAIAWVFFINPAEEKPGDTADTTAPAATPAITQTPPNTTSSNNTSTKVVPEVTASGNKIAVSVERDRGFTPKNKTIKPGDEVAWTNEGTYTITLSSADGLFEDYSMNIGKTKRYIFKKAGTYTFNIKGREDLKGTIIVET